MTQQTFFVEPSPESAIPSAATQPGRSAASLEYNGPPQVIVPRVPTFFISTGMREYFGFRATQDEVASAGRAIKDLEKIATDGNVLGIPATLPPPLAHALARALEWRKQRERAEALLTYAQEGDGRAWKVALTLLAEMKPLYEFAASKDGNFARKYPGLDAVMKAGKASSKKANKTKKQKKVAKEAALKKAQVDAAKAAADAAKAAAAAAKGAGGATATPHKSITVNT